LGRFAAEKEGRGRKGKEGKRVRETKERGGGKREGKGCPISTKILATKNCSIWELADQGAV